jgi:hypothetical protein
MTITSGSAPSPELTDEPLGLDRKRHGAAPIEPDRRRTLLTVGSCCCLPPHRRASASAILRKVESHASFEMPQSRPFRTMTASASGAT